MKDVSSVRNIPQPREVPRQVRQEPERQERVERTERNVERHSTTRTVTSTETSHSVQSRGRQEAVQDSEHRLLYMRNAARVFEDTNPVTQTLTYTQQASQVTSQAVEPTRPMLDVSV